MSDYLIILKRRAWTVAITVGFACAVAIVYVSLAPTRFTATALVRMTPYGNGPLDYGSFVYSDQLAKTFVDMAGSKAVAQDVMDQLQLSSLPPHRTALMPGSELLAISATAGSADLAARTANGLATALLTHVVNQVGNKLSRVKKTMLPQIHQLESNISGLVVQQAELEAAPSGDKAQIAVLDKLIAAQQSRYQDLLGAYNSSIVAQTNQQSVLSISQPAIVPQSPDGPKRILSVLTALIVGLIGGAALAFYREGADPRAYTLEQLVRVTGLPILGGLPKMSRRMRKRDSLLAGVEALKRVAVNLQAQLREDGSNAVLVTSAYKGDGKSQFICDLARLLASSSKTVLLIDANIHDPSLHEEFKLANNVGLSSLLHDGSGDARDAVQASATPRLTVLASGPRRDNTSELLSSDVMSKLVANFRQAYDFVLVDGPGVLERTDAVVLAEAAESVVFVSNPNAHTRALRASLVQLDAVGARVVGLVVNRFRAYGHSRLDVIAGVGGHLGK